MTEKQIKVTGSSAIGPGFKTGHPRVGGRKPGSQNKRTKQAIEICEAMGFHPAAFLATIALTGQMPNPDGTSTPVGTEERLRAAQALAPFVMPKLQSTQVTGGNDGPVEVNGLVDMRAIMADPVALELAQALALKMAGCDDVIQLPKELPPASE